MYAQRAYAVFFALILSLLALPSWSLGLNLALPANGGVATASSTHSPSFPVSGANNGDRKGTNWGAGGGWNDGTASIYPDWLQITFNGQKNIEQIDLFTVQDNYTNPIEPTASLSFTQYGLKNFEVQYWNGTSWLTIPGGSVSNNTLIWRKFTFSAISTDRIRIHISNALAGYSRITELEVYEAGGVANTPPSVNLTAPANNTNYTAPASITINASATDSDGSITQVEFYNGATLLNTDTSAPYSYTWNNVPQGSYSLTAKATDNSGAVSTSTPININVNPAGGQAKNLALPSNGGVATASSTYSNSFPVSGINNGDRKGVNWGAGGGWNDATASVYPDWVQINFNGQKNINKIDLFTVQDNYTNPIEPTASTSFTQYGLKNFEVQYWNGASWLTIPGGSVTNNTLIWRSFSFASINTDRIRIYISNALAGYSRITELEVYEAAVVATPPTVTLSANPQSIVSGASSTLTWSSTNATSCTASGAWSGAKATSGNQSTGALSASSSYTLTCTGAGGSAAQTATVTVTPAGGNPVDNLQAGQWYAFPNSNMSAVDPCPTRNCSYSGVEGQAAVMDDWAGGAYDTSRDRLMVWGGGHDGYGGNEVYAFSLSTGAWSRLTEPSDPISRCTDFYPDGRPAAAHSYNFLQYVPALDSFTTFSAGQFCGNGGYGALGAVALNLTSNNWSKRAPHPGGSHIGAITAYDPSTGYVWMKATGYSPSYDAATTLYKYDPIADTWTAGDSGNSDLAYAYGLTAAIDPTRKKMLAVGEGKVIAWDISNPTNVTRQNINSTGANSIVNANDPGLAYDPVSDRFVAWDGGANVYTLNPDTWVWTLVTPASTNTITPTAANSNGTYGRFRYIPSKNAFIVVNATTENVYVYKLNNGAPPPQPAPTVSLSASPASVSSGGSSSLVWSSTNATSCVASGAWSGARATTGAETINALSATSTFTLTCSGSGGSQSQSVTVTVTPAVPAPTVALSANPSSVASGGSSTLTWSSSNATSCTASGAWTGSKALSGNQSTGALSASSTYTLSCTGSGGSTLQSVTITVTPAGAHPIDSLLPGQWYEVPNSKMSGVDPCPANNCPYTGVQGQKSVINAWSGGVYDTYRDRLVVWGGGHADYAGNEIYAFDVPSLLWVRVTNPSLNVTPNVAYYGDGMPTSRHTNSSLVYDSTRDSMVTCGAPSIYGDGSSRLESDAFSFSTNTWMSIGSVPPTGGYQLAIGDFAVYDAQNDRMWCHTTYGGALWEFNLGTKAWTLHAQRSLEITATAAMDTKRHRMVSLGGYGNVRQFFVWDLNNPNAPATSPVTSGAPGGIALESSSGPGFEYDPVNDVYVAWKGGAVVYTLNPDTWVWTQINPSAQNSVIPTPADVTGTYGRFRYMPSKNAFIVVNSTTENVFVYKLSAGGGAPPLPTVLFSSSPALVNSGGSSVLNWSSTNATSCTASGAWSGARATAGAETINNINSTSTFTLTCSGAGGSASQSVTVTVAAGTPAPTVSLSANPLSIASGAASTLTWSSTNATSCNASGAWSGAKALSGSQSTGALSASSTYTLTCSGAGGSTAQSVTVSIAAIGQIASLNMLSNSGSGQTSVPLTFGHSFKLGDVPAGVGLSAKLSDSTEIPLQLDSKATHADGSLRHGVVTVNLPSLGAGATQSVVLSSAVSSSGTPVQLSQLLASTFDAVASLQLGAITYTASARNLLQTTTPKVWLSGPLVSEWVVGGAVKDSLGNAHPHLTAYFHVRAYAGLNRVRVDTVIENNWTRIAGPQDFTYDVNLTVGGVTAYSKTGLTHYHHARWHKVAWWGSQPQATVLHDANYLQNSKAVSKYASLTPSETYLNGMLSSIEPMQNGNIEAYMPTTGAQDGIGPLPRWTAAYVVSGDARAKRATLLNGDAGGAYSIHYRDETTGDPVSIAQYPNLSEQNNSLPNVGSTSQPYTHDDAHQPSIAYVPYLLSGDYFYLEELQFWATWNLIIINDAYRQYEKGIMAGQTRAQAWSLRELGRAAAVTPDAHPLKGYFTGIVDNNIANTATLYANNPSASPLGIMLDYYDGYTNVALWQHDFYTWTYGHLVDLGFSQAVNMRNWMAKLQVGRMGQSSSEYCYVYAAPYRINVGPNDTTTYPDFRSWYQALWPTESQSACPAPTPNNMVGYSDDASGYPSNMRPALAVGVDAGLPGALNAWNRLLIGSQPNYNDDPQWAVSPR